MLGKRLWSLVAGIVPAISLAAPVQFDFSGSFGQSGGTVLGLSLAGQSFTGTLTYNDDPALVVPVSSSYFLDVLTPYAITFNVAGNTISSNGFAVREMVGSQLRIDAGTGSSAGYTQLSVNGVASSAPASGLFIVFYADSSNPLNTLPIIPSTLTAPGYGYVYDDVWGSNDHFASINISKFGPATPAVPEPGGPGMMMVGLAAVGFAVRSKKRAAF